MNKNVIFIIVIISAIIVSAGVFGYLSLRDKNGSKTGLVTILQPQTVVEPTEYRNAQYGFSFSLPMSWEGYSIITDNWEGYPLDVQNAAKVEGPQILIRHHQWTSMNPRQDIPIMVFTMAQWNLIEQRKLSVGAAPIGPSELGRNARYVFALPARYNFAFPTGWEEVEKILRGEPLSVFKALEDEQAAEWKVYRNEKYGFEIKYPPVWEVSLPNDPTDVIVLFYQEAPEESTENPVIWINVLDQYRGKELKEVFNGVKEPKYDFSTDCQAITFVGLSAYRCSPLATLAGEDIILFASNGLIFEINNSILNQKSNDVISTFRFIQ